MTILDGKEVAKKAKGEIKKEVAKLKAEGIIPGLAVILVGDDPASQTYVNSKEKACVEAGIFSEKITMQSDTTQEMLLNKIKKLNEEMVNNPFLLTISGVSLFTFHDMEKYNPTKIKLLFDK